MLIASSVFNGDDILSLEAPGAQVQLIGNLRCVLYAVLPGEEQHFTMRVGSEDFSYSGMIFLAVPATLAQLDQVADLKEAKDKAEDAYDAISDSLDVILDTLESMSSSMNETAAGLDRLDNARETVSAGKNQVYADLDAALDAAGPLVDSMKPMSAHLETLSHALDDLDALYDDTNANLQQLRPEPAPPSKSCGRLPTRSARLRRRWTVRAQMQLNLQMNSSSILQKYRKFFRS